MIIKQKSSSHILKIVKILNKILVAVALALIILFSFFFSKENRNNVFIINKLNNSSEETPPRFDPNSIGSGGLSLSSEIQSFPFPDLHEEILFLAKNTRPDATLHEIKFQIGLKGREKSLQINPGQTVYLTYEQRYLNFSKEETTPLWIKPYLNENGELWLQMGIHLKDSQGNEILKEMREFQIKQNWKAKKMEEVSNAELKIAGDALKQGKWWAPDKLFEKYGGKEFLQYSGRERIELPLSSGRQILFIDEGEVFVWREGVWVSSEETKGLPMGKVIAISPYKVEWQLWDKEGMESVLLTFNKEKSCGALMRIDESFTKLRRRTSSRVSCRIDNHAAILKKGDWLIHANARWYTIKNYHEIEAILNLDIQGDLFIFDGVEKVEGKEVFCGTLFNRMRTQEHFIRLPLARTKSGEHSTPMKNTFSTKIVPLVNEESLIKSCPSNNSNQKREPLEEYDIFDEG